jgi:outer membrane protein assembly factor BamD
MIYPKQFKKLSFVILLTLSALLAACSSSTVDEYAGIPSQQIFSSANTALADGDYAQAVKDYEALETHYPFGDHAEQAALNIIYAYYKAGDYSAATAAANRFIHVYPSSRHVDYAYYMKGVTSLMQDRSITQRYFKLDLSERSLASAKQAFRDFDELVRLFPNSPYNADARQRMIYLRNLFAKHELNVALFYYNREAYVSAAQRADNIVLHYQQSPFVANALAIMTLSYRALNLPELADKSYKLLAYNFPDSKELKAVDKGEVLDEKSFLETF